MQSLEGVNRPSRNEFHKIAQWRFLLFQMVEGRRRKALGTSMKIGNDRERKGGE